MALLRMNGSLPAVGMTSRFVGLRRARWGLRRHRAILTSSGKPVIPNGTEWNEESLS
jgi:hypothetical protein